jgi:hypothetical protein
MMNMKPNKAFRWLLPLVLTVPLGAFAQELPKPDGKPGDSTKPVQVYILAGQSNMVGMGEVGGAKNMYSGIYLTSDPAAPAGPLTIYKIGNYKIGHVTVYQTDGNATKGPLSEGLLEVPESGIYQIHSGVTMVVNGMKVDQDVKLEAGKRYPFKMSSIPGQPPRFWMQKMDLLGHGDLESTVKRDGKFPWLVDDKGEWSVRNDVYFQEARVAEDGKGSPLTATSNGKSIGPELGFGHVMGTFHGEQVLLIKTAMGNRALGYDFRPPSSGRNDPESKWESLEYKLMLEGVNKTLAMIDKVVPGYKGQGYEIAGFAWFQGHKDSFTEELIDEYEKNLANLINDVRKEFKAPKLPAVVATVGFQGHNMDEKFVRIFNAQMAVSDPGKHPEFAGNVASVNTRDFWREVDESPTNQDYHYNRNAETYMLIGDAIGRAMVGLKGGKMTALPLEERPKKAPKDPSAEAKEPDAVAKAALAPIVVDGIAAEYMANPKNNPALLAAATGEKPQRTNQFLKDSIDGLASIYEAAGIDDYEWHTFGKDWRDLEWDYLSFTPSEEPGANAGRYRKVTYPVGSEKWFETDFDTTKAGWKKGLPPFGQKDGKLEPLRECLRENSICGCGEKPRTPWEKEVLLIRGTFEVPPLRDGYRYRIVVGGSAHVNAGEGYAIHVNGKPLAESNRGVGKREGAQARGGHIHADMRDEFKSGKVTVAATSFLRFTDNLANGHITLWLEEQKIPEIKPAANSAK